LLSSKLKSGIAKHILFQQVVPYIKENEA